MADFVASIPSVAIPENASDFQLQVASRVGKIKETFVEVGYYLSLCERNKWYLTLGYDSLAACAESLFDIKKSTCYALISIAERFSLNGVLDDRFKRFSQSQLVALAPSYSFHLKYYLKNIPSDASVLDIRDVVRCSKNTNQFLLKIEHQKEYTWNNLVEDSKAYLFRSNGKVSKNSDKKKKIKGADAYNTAYSYLSGLFKNVDGLDDIVRHLVYDLLSL